MKLRIGLARFLIRLGKFFQSLPVMVMKPDDFAEFNHQNYSRPKTIKSWSKKELIQPGLNQEEQSYLDNIPLKKGSILVLGLGGGREAIPMAKKGFKVTGVDFIPELIKMAKENARRYNVSITGLTQDINQLNVPPNCYDIVWLSAGMYSVIPTKKRRMEILKRIQKTLKPNGYFVCQFHFDFTMMFYPKIEFLKKLFAFFTFGNFQYERGDMLWGNTEYIHTFISKDSLKQEFENSGFHIIDMFLPDNTVRGGAILRCRSNANLKPPLIKE